MRKSILQRLEGIFLHYRFKIQCRTSLLLRRQIKNPEKIPVIIINYNQLHFLKKLIDALLDLNCKNIVVIDNDSTYPPLLDYYKEISGKVTVEVMGENLGHKVLFSTSSLVEKYCKGFYIVTDPDIGLNPKMKKGFQSQMIEFLDKYFRQITKVGLALDISDIPDFFPAKEKVLKWENKFWLHQKDKNIYRSRIDTTFALYKPGYPKKHKNIGFFEAIRIAGSYTAKHWGWYIDPENPTDEQKYFRNQKNISSSWRIDAAGTHQSATKNDYKR